MTIANKFARRLCSLFAAFGLILGVGVAQAQTVIYYHTDALGSPVATTNAAGVVIERTEYEPYGQVLNEPVTDGPGYTGHVSDAQTGLSYMQQRYYDPGIGKFLSVDPVTAQNGDLRHFNRYAYAYNNPYKFNDPDGRCPSCVGAAVGAGLEILVQGVEIYVGTRTEFDGTDILISAVAGATGVGAAKLIGRGADIGRLAKFALNRTADAGISAGSQLAKDGEVSLSDTAIDVVGGAVVGDAVGSRAAAAAAKSPAGKLLARQADRAARVATGSSRAARQQAASSARAAQQGFIRGAEAKAGVVSSNATSSGVEITCAAKKKDC